MARGQRAHEGRAVGEGAGAGQPARPGVRATMILWRLASSRAHCSAASSRGWDGLEQCNHQERAGSSHGRVDHGGSRAQPQGTRLTTGGTRISHKGNTVDHRGSKGQPQGEQGQPQGEQGQPQGSQETGKAGGEGRDRISSRPAREHQIGLGCILWGEVSPHPLGGRVGEAAAPRPRQKNRGAERG